MKIKFDGYFIRWYDIHKLILESWERMAVTMAQKIQQLETENERLKQEVKYYKEYAKKLEDTYNQNNVIGMDAYDKLKADCDYYIRQLEIANKSHLTILKQERKRHDDLIECYKAQKTELQTFREEGKTDKPHNERGAGRKTKINETFVLKAKEYRKAGNTYPVIAGLLGLSIGTVYKMLNPDRETESRARKDNNDDIQSPSSSAQPVEPIEGQMSVFNFIN